MRYPVPSPPRKYAQSDVLSSFDAQLCAFKKHPREATFFLQQNQLSSLDRLSSWIQSCDEIFRRIILVRSSCLVNLRNNYVSSNVTSSSSWNRITIPAPDGCSNWNSYPSLKCYPPFGWIHSAFLYLLVKRMSTFPVELLCSQKVTHSKRYSECENIQQNSIEKKVFQTK